MKRINWYIVGKYLVGTGILLTTVGFILINIYEDYRPREYVQWIMTDSGPQIVGKTISNKKFVKTLSSDGTITEENIKFYAQVIKPSFSIFSSCSNPQNPQPNPQPIPEDPNTQPKQIEDWGFLKIKAKEANAITQAKEITVCVLDTGLDRSHPDVSAIKGQDFTNSGDWNDIFGHGTHVAGIIAAINNSVGNVGASQAKLIVGKVLSDDGSGTLEAIAQGINWCVKEGAQVINMSLGGGGPSQLLYQAIMFATQNGVKVMAAAGNDGGQTNYPAAFQIPGLFAISATDQNDAITNFSSRGKIEFAAPGLNIYSTLPMHGNKMNNQKGWGYLSGTSMATPYASAVMALSLSVGKMPKADQVGIPSYYGYGRVNAIKSVQ